VCDNLRSGSLVGFAPDKTCHIGVHLCFHPVRPKVRDAIQKDGYCVLFQGSDIGPA